MTFCLLMVFIDFRCFISADRYPRVGIVRTAAVAAFFALTVFASGDGSEGILPVLLASLTAVVISIQVLAPQHQELVSHVNAGKKNKTNADHPTQAASDLEATNIKTDELEMQVIQKEGH